MQRKITIFRRSAQKKKNLARPLHASQIKKCKQCHASCFPQQVVQELTPGGANHKCKNLGSSTRDQSSLPRLPPNEADTRSTLLSWQDGSTQGTFSFLARMQRGCLPTAALPPAWITGKTFQAGRCEDHNGSLNLARPWLKNNPHKLPPWVMIPPALKPTASQGYQCGIWTAKDPGFFSP